MKEELKDGEWVLTIDSEKDKVLYETVMKLADVLGMEPDSRAFSNRINSRIREYSEKILNCEHEWQADSCGMMVSRYSCKHCGIEKMVSDPC